ECPKCHVTIEKDGGCNHMVCRNQNCKAEFCWVCLGPWEPHGSAWAALQRYLFYCNRYMNHMQSLRFEHKLYAQVKQKMEEMQQHNMSWIEVQFLKKAVDVLCQCRSTLMFTYVFAFYLKKNNQSIIFEVRWLKALFNANPVNHQNGNTKLHKCKIYKISVFLGMN
ncbi:E3 ubiquitin-protein ligase arih1l, partial [Goodea atripinnis]